MDATNTEAKTSSPRRSPVPSKSTSAITRQNMDRERELQRLKSLGVVSVLNKTFRSQDNLLSAPAPMPSPSSSTSTLALLGERPTPSPSDLIQQRRPSSDNSSLPDPERRLRKPSFATSDHWVMTILPAEQDQPGPTDENGNSAASETLDRPVFNSSNDTMDQQRLQEDAQRQMERTTQKTLEGWLKQKELESIKVHQLSSLVLKQDLVIHQLESSLSLAQSENEQLRKDTCSSTLTTTHQQELVALRQELAALQVHKTGYEKMIVSLCSELESSQDETRKLTLLTTRLHEQCQAQQQQIDEKLDRMGQQLADKDALIRKYRDELLDKQLIPQRYSQYMNDTATIHSVLSTPSSRASTAFSEHDVDLLTRYSSSSSSRLSARTRNSLPRRRGKAATSVLSWPGGCIPPPSGPPPSSPLPPLPILDDDQVDPELKHMTRPPPYLEESSLEQLLLQAPSGYTLDDETTMNEAYREFTEQLQTRLSTSKEIDHLELWDHERLRQHHQQKQAAGVVVPTPSSSSSLESDHNTAFWKGMKNKLRV